MDKALKFLDVQFTVVIPVGTGELKFEISKHLSLGDGFRYGDRSEIVLNCHEPTLTTDTILSQAEILVLSTPSRYT